MSLTEKTTHAAESRARLLSQFKGLPKIEGVVSAQAAQTQDEETAFYDLLENRSLANSVGVQLDGIGEIVGEERKGKDDDTYRIYLEARILVNSSSGTAPQINEIADLLIDDANAQAYSELYPAAFKIVVGDEFPTDIDAVAELLSGARLGGVRGFVEYTEVDDDETFTFADGDAIQVDAAKGFTGNLADNGDFDDWTANNPDDWVVSESLPNQEISEVGSGASHGGAGNGSCNIFSNSSTVTSINQIRTLIPGDNYTVTVTISAITGSLTVADIFGSHYAEYYTTPGTKVINFTATSPNLALYMRNTTGGGVDATIDSINLMSHAGGFADVAEA